MEAYERRIPSDVLRLAVSVVLWGATTVAAASIVLMLINDEPLDYVLFDVISAFATCGLEHRIHPERRTMPRNTCSRPPCSSAASVL